MSRKLNQLGRLIKNQKLSVNPIPAQQYSTNAPQIINKANAIKNRNLILEVSIEIIKVLIKKVNIIFNGHQPLITLPKPIYGIDAIRPNTRRRFIVGNLESVSF